MRKIKIKEHLSVDEVREKMLSAKDKSDFRHWQAIYLILSKEYTAPQTADVVGVETHSIHQWIYYYNKFGPEALMSKPKGGRRTALMSLEEEKSFLNKVVEEAKQGDHITVKKIKMRVEELLGRKVSKDFSYDLLHRHGWKKIVPRPKHPKSNLQKQGDFKKNSPNCWRPFY